ncbi:UDP-Glycosyltransferase/glycogen phosphorylase, partial [Corynespora cassiicola Philippines]
DDGRIDIDVNSGLAETLVNLVPKNRVSVHTPSRRLTIQRSWNIRLNIVIQVVGSRGDVQPFIALGQELQKHGHRVRLATHDCFDSFVQDSGLEFYPIGGDPKELMAYMVKNPGLLPSMKTLRKGEVQHKRTMITEILFGCWRSCIDPDPKSQEPFTADAIIANPPSFAHIHCAQALGIPLHLVFTMPWSSTRAFPHPLANLRTEKVDPEFINFASYGIVEFLTWKGLGDVINKFRRSLDLEPIPASVGPLIVETLEIPFTYCWSPALVPKPVDWNSHIDVCGFFFRDPPLYNPPADIDKFLRFTPPPIYVGFGSVVIDNPEKMTSLILEAIDASGVRAIISKGWSNLGKSLTPYSENVLFIDDCPHEWLFQHVTAVVHHGGAGTTACGLRNGRPTVVVPFFGDQLFWGRMVAAAGAGPDPIPHQSLTSEALSRAIAFCLTSEANAVAQDISSRMASERGTQAAVQSFHANLPFETTLCDVIPNLPAAWSYKKAPIRLSKLAAGILVNNSVIDWNDLSSYETSSTYIENNRWDPVTATASAYASLIGKMGSATMDMLCDPYAEMKRSHSESSNSATTAGRAVIAGAKGFGRFNIALVKGTLIDIPFAAAEGFRLAPKLYGEDVKDHGKVKDVKSGLEVAGKNFAHGLYDGFTDLYKRPYEDAKSDGALGFVKGLSKGTLGFVTKTASATVGIVAYPGQGISQSIRHMAKSGTRRDIKSRKMAESEHLMHNYEPRDFAEFVAIFECLRKE